MATKKITEAVSAESVKRDASILITQQENDEGTDKESLRRATIDKIVEILRQSGVNDGYQTVAGIEAMYPGLVKSVDATDDGIRIMFWDDTSSDIAIESGGLAFDEITYDQEQGYFHIMLGGEDVVAPCYIGGGGGGGSSSSGTVVRLENLTGASSLTVAHGESCPISFSFYDYDSSNEFTNSSGALQLYINNTVVLSKNIAQGSHTIDIKDYLVEGTNKVKIKVTNEDDMYGMKTWTVNAVALSISSTFDDTAINTGSVLFRYTPIGNNISKTIHFKVDGSEIASTVVTASNRQQTQVIPAQSHGSHRLTVYATASVDGVEVTSNILNYDVMWLEEGIETEIIACSFIGEATQFSTVAIPYIVVTPSSLTSQVTLAVNGEVVSALSVDRSRQIWNYKPMTEGTDTLTITCGSTVKTITLVVKSIGINVEPITTGLIVDLNPVGKTNNDNDRADFGYIDGNGVNHPLVFSDNFDWTNGGFQTDADGNTYFCVKCGTSVSFDRGLFTDDAMRSGKEIKMIFKATNCRDYDAQIASCMHDGVGLVVQAQKATLKSQQTTMEVPYCEDSLIEMDINIEPDSKDLAMMIWLEGVPSKVAIYAANDNFTQDVPQMLTIGSNDCDVWIYRIKAYENDLTRLEIHENWIADALNAEEMIARYNRNNIYDQNGNIDIQKLITASPGLRVIQLEAARMTTGKKDKVPTRVTHTYRKGGATHCFVSEGVQMKAQGTSSMQYGEAAYNLDLEFINGFDFEDGTHTELYSMSENSIGVNYINIKLNVASSENANNIVLQEDYNNLQPYINPARRANPKVRDTMEGHPCVIFFTNSGTEPTKVSSVMVQPGETILYGCGDFNNSKKNYAVFGQNGTNPNQMCVEVSNNTNDPCLFRSDDLSEETWDGNGSFEFRYPDSPTQAHKNAFQRLLSWVVSTDRTAATGDTLSAPKTYGETTYTEDTAEYRAAKFVNEFEDYFIKDSIIFHYLFTERHAMVDSRAKNCFLSTDDGIHWDLTKDYDNDTGEGNDNEGGLTLSYGMEDTDTIGQKDVFNASNSTLWVNIRDLMFDDLREMYISLESRNAWKADRILQKFTEHQSPRPEALVMEDMWKKYIYPYTRSGVSSYLEMMYGTKADQRKNFEIYQEKYMATKYMGSAATSDTITFRAYTPQNWQGVAPSSNITVTPYADMYIVIKSGSGLARQRAKRGVAYTIACPIDTLNDTEIYLYGASNIQDVGDLAPLYVGYFNIAPAIKLRSLKLGDGTTGYTNTNATSITLGNNVLLESLDIQNCPNINHSLDLTNCHALLTLNAQGSGITGVSFAPGGKIEEAHIPNIATLSARSLKALQTLDFESYSGLRTIRIEDCPTIDVKSIVASALGITRIRILGIDWTGENALSNTDILDRLVNAKGLDESDHNLEQSVVTGAVYVPVIKQSLLNKYMAAWAPDLDITYGTLVQQYLVTFQNWDGTVLHSEYVDRGNNVEDPTPHWRQKNDVRFVIGSSEPVNPIVGDYWYDNSNAGALKQYNGDEWASTEISITAGTDAPTNPTHGDWWYDTEASKLMEWYKIIDIPTRPSTDSTVYAYDRWEGSLSTIIAAKTIVALYTETPRTYRVRWYSQVGVKLDEQVVDYGDEAIYSGEFPTRTEEEESRVYYLFKGWHQSTGCVRRDIDVFAEWDRGELVEPDALNGPFFEDLRPAELYAVAKNRTNAEYDFNGMVSVKDHTDITMGFDPDFSNVEHEDLIDGPVYFDGHTYRDTGIQLLKDGVSKPWTVVVDCKFDVDTNDQTMVCCFQENGYMGFKVKYTGGPAVQWSTNRMNSGATTNREIMVIRHIAGDRNVRCYSSKAYSATIGFSELVKSIDTQANSSIVLGATKTDGGQYGNYATGWLYSCRVWYDDLGDDNCRNLVSWPRETYRYEVGNIASYNTTESSITNTNIDFICASLLERTRQMNTVNTNAGGFAAMPMFSWMQSRLYYGYPQVWRSMMKQCNIPYIKYVDGTNHDVQRVEAYVWLPSYIEVQTTTAEPWIYEGQWVTFFTSNLTRIKWFAHIPRDGYQIFTSDSDPTLSSSNHVVDGDVWIKTSESSRGYLRVDGKWLGAHSFWLRGASITYSTNFGFVYYTGNANNTGNGAAYSSGVCPRFSI